MCIRDRNQILAYFTPTDNIDVTSFTEHVVAKNTGHITSEITAKFEELFGSGVRVGAADIESRLIAEGSPEVAQGLINFLSAYEGSDGLYGAEEFGLIHADLYACTDVGMYSSLVRDLWG